MLVTVLVTDYPPELRWGPQFSKCEGRLDYSEEPLMRVEEQWQTISEDPNDPKVMQSRRAAISTARSERLIVDRVAYLCGLVSNKSVLDIGVVAHTRGASTSS